VFLATVKAIVCVGSVRVESVAGKEESWADTAVQIVKKKKIKRCDIICVLPAWAIVGLEKSVGKIGPQQALE
jgi:triosephosphate isomerase